MAKQSLSGLWLAASVFLVVFVTLFGFRLGLFSGFPENKASLVPAEQSLPDRETWMKILQNDEKIGYSHSVFKNRDDHYTLEEDLFLQISLMGLTHRVHLDLSAVLNTDLTLRSFESRLRSGRFAFSAQGEMSDKTLAITTRAEGNTHEIRFPVTEAPYLPAGLIHAVCNSGMAPKDFMSVNIFDPSSMSIVPVRITVGEKEIIKVMNVNQAATRLEIDYKGMVQQVWISEHGEVIRESGLMGLSLEKVGKHEALAGIDGNAGDLTDLVAIEVNVTFDDPRQLEMLKVRIEGVDLKPLMLSGGRQIFSGNELTITKESSSRGMGAGVSKEALARFLMPDALIQSDHPDIRQLAARVAPPNGTDRSRAEKLMRWVYQNIDKQPVISMPNALSTLTHRQGDCNEHAMLLAALARAADIPAQVETGIVYLQGKFFYHAWNRFYVEGGWVTADAAFGQIPADVTHIRLAGGHPEQQLDLIPVIGRIRLTVIDYAPGRS